jgi:hypothetical protein
MEVLAGEWGLSYRSRQIICLTHPFGNPAASSPEFRTPHGLSEFMSSPFDSPFDDFLTTPADVDPTSPMLDFSANDLPLFSDLAIDMMSKADECSSAPPVAIKESPFSPTMQCMPSPFTPALDPSSLYASFDEPADAPASLPSSTRRKSTATGTRKNITPEALVPVDAPTQSRHYTMPSATSRKVIPAVFARKRARTQAFGDDDELADEVFTLPPNPTEAQLIEAKRRQNTVAARRSRKRKLEYQRELEESNQRLEDERDQWKARALTSEALLKSHGLEVPQFDT